MIGEAIKKARKNRKLTAEQLAEKAEITQSMVSRYESGRVNPTKDVVKRIESALGVKLNDESSSVDNETPFDQREFDQKIARTRNLSTADKKALLTIVNAFLKLKDMEAMLKAED